MGDRLADMVLDLVRAGGLTVTKTPGRAWRIVATSAKGETWAAEHEDRYRAACLLVKLVGVDLEG